MDKNIIAVIGDIHGCINTLEKLYKKISDFKCKVYSVGDLIDRGNYSKEVVQFCINEKIHPVRGNHEQILLDALYSYKKYFNKDTKDRSLLDFCYELDVFYINGGYSTQKNYTGTESRAEFYKLEEKLKKLEHLNFFENLPMKIELKNIVITHAGIIKGTPEIYMLWNRNTPSNIGKFQIFGHTPHSNVMTDYKNYINIDTGCVYGKKLTSVILNLKSTTIEEILSVEAEIKDYEKD